jgi:hypothetical protein
VKNKYLVTVIDDQLDQIHGANYFSKIDLRSGYHQIRMKIENIPKTVFRTHEGQVFGDAFWFNKCSYYLSGSNEQYIQATLKKICVNFFYDILIYNPNKEMHHAHIAVVLQILMDNHLFVKETNVLLG